MPTADARIHQPRLARAGHTSPEIGTQLYLSPRTIERHLRMVFTKLGISSRRELRAALAAPGPSASLVQSAQRQRPSPPPARIPAALQHRW